MMQLVPGFNHPRCDCHECTQARWKMSLDYKWSSGLGQSQGIPQQAVQNQQGDK